MKKTRLLGIDPGIGRTGYGLIETWEDNVQHVEHGCLETNKNDTRQDRILDLYTQFSQLLDHLKPDVAGVEHLYAGRNATTAIQVAEARVTPGETPPPPSRWLKPAVRSC